MELKYKEIFIEKRYKTFRGLTTSLQNLSPGEIGLMEHQNEKYKRMLTCSVCSIRQKKVILQSCCHTYCR